MKHYGDITKINGVKVEPVDVITGGSPCQDLSVAGKRLGLAGERSGLFMEQIRIIKEIRENAAGLHSGRTNEYVRPRYMVWENVCGAFTSNNGEDFRAVLEETCRVVDKNAVVPAAPNGKWSYAGCIMGTVDGREYSVAWRTHDAQYWGVPQRRRRIALVADFGGTTAPEILFGQDCLFGNIEKGKEAKEESARADVRFYSSKSFGGWTEDHISQTIRASGGDYGGGSETLILDHIGLRKKTPIETERLFGFPDGWTDIGDWNDENGKRHKSADACRYKALGNSIALPFWRWMAKRMSDELREGSTMASLFDGIGGFPLCFSEAGVKPIWASEIEQFPIAVTKIHFPEEKTDEHTQKR